MQSVPPTCKNISCLIVHPVRPDQWALSQGNLLICRVASFPNFPTTHTHSCALMRTQRHTLIRGIGTSVPHACQPQRAPSPPDHMCPSIMHGPMVISHLFFDVAGHLHLFLCLLYFQNPPKLRILSSLVSSCDNFATWSAEHLSPSAGEVKNNNSCSSELVFSTPSGLGTAQPSPPLPRLLFC